MKPCTRANVVVALRQRGDWPPSSPQPADGVLSTRAIASLRVLQVKIAVVTRTVAVHHSPARVSPGALVAALNEALLEASLAPPRALPAGGHCWVPPPSTLAAAALLLLSCVHYLSPMTGEDVCSRYSRARRALACCFSHFLEFKTQGDGSLDSCLSIKKDCILSLDIQ